MVQRTKFIKMMNVGKNVGKMSERCRKDVGKMSEGKAVSTVAVRCSAY